MVIRSPKKTKVEYFITCWIKRLHWFKLLQKSDILTNLIASFLCVCLFAIFVYTILILRIPNTRVNRQPTKTLGNYNYRRIPVFNRNMLPHNRHRDIRIPQRHRTGIKTHLRLPGRALLKKPRSIARNKYFLYEHYVDKFIKYRNTTKNNDNKFEKLSYVINSLACTAKTDNYAPKIDLLVLLFTSVKNKQNRDALRETWLSYTNNNTANTRYVFLLGTSDSRDNRDIAIENKQYGDILQGNFIDSYRNLTMKTILGLKWATEHCNHAKFVLKTDDDVWVNIPSLLNYVNKVKPATFTIGGRCQAGRPHRDPTSKYFVSNSEYPLDIYPPYCSGTGYITTPQIASKLLNISNYVPYFPLEDVYIALCLVKLKVSVVPILGFYNDNQYKPWQFVKRNSNIILLHRFNPTELRQIWKGVYSSSNSITSTNTGNVHV